MAAGPPKEIIVTARISKELYRQVVKLQRDMKKNKKKMTRSSLIGLALTELVDRKAVA